MIISASRRTDIPAFYAEWFVNRIREGFCLWVNPFNPKQASVINLEPEQVDLIVFWTRYPRPIMPYLKELDGLGYRYYFHYTLTGYPRILEPNLPDLDICISTLKELADRIGRERIIWRYDPILISQVTDFAYHERRFAELAQEIGGCCHHVVVSFFDSYRAAAARLRKLGPEYQPLPEEQTSDQIGDFMRHLAQTAASFGLRVYTCAESADFSVYGVRPGKCIDDEYISEVFGIEVTHQKDPNQRKACRCVVSKDIGRYNTCLFGCQYCYANGRP